MVARQLSVGEKQTKTTDPFVCVPLDFLIERKCSERGKETTMSLVSATLAQAYN
jgi:hypothetical protein